MPISVHSDVTSVLDATTAGDAGKIFGASGEQVQSAIEQSSLTILESLAKSTKTIDGAEKVYRAVGQFTGRMIEGLRISVDSESVLLATEIGEVCVEEIVGEEKTATIKASIQKQFGFSEQTASQLVAFSASLLADQLGEYRQKFGLKRDNLTEIIRSQTDLTQSTSSTHRELFSELGLSAKQMANRTNATTAASPIPSNPKVNPTSETKKFDQAQPLETAFEVHDRDSAKAPPEESTRTTTVAISSFTPEASKKQTFRSRLTKLSKNRLLLIVPTLLIAITACSWLAVNNWSTSAPSMSAGSSTRDEPKGPVVASANASTTTPSSNGSLDSNSASLSSSPSTTSTTSDATSAYRTKQIAISNREQSTPRVRKFPARPVRFETLGHERLPNAVEFTVAPEPLKTYWWDNRTVEVEDGYQKMAAWTVRVQPRNQGQQTRFSFE